MILDNGYIELIEVWGSDERIIESARMSTGKGFLGWGYYECSKCGCKWRDNYDNTMSLLDSEQKSCNICEYQPLHKLVKISGDEKLLKYLWNNRHTTPFEQCGVTFEVQAPIMVFREWHRHRTQSYNEFSARYEQMPNLHYLPTVERCKMTSATNKQAQALIDSNDGHPTEDLQIEKWIIHAEFLQQQIYDHYEIGLKMGIPKEVARLNTPVSRYSKMRASGNLLNWLRFLGLRDAPNAMFEIREYAKAASQLITEKFPRTMELFQEKRI